MSMVDIGMAHEEENLYLYTKCLTLLYRIATTRMTIHLFCAYMNIHDYVSGIFVVKYILYIEKNYGMMQAYTHAHTLTHEEEKKFF